MHSIVNNFTASIQATVLYDEFECYDFKINRINSVRPAIDISDRDFLRYKGYL